MEDVDFMRRKSVRQNFVFLVDSRDRDRAAWPTPAEYQVTFAAPFHHVIGLELLDADVPRTMYNVDAFNQTLRLFVHAPGLDVSSSAALAWATVTLPAGDYTIHTLVPALNAVLAMHLNGDPGLPLAPITAAAVSNPPEVLGKLQFTCAYPFILDMGSSSLAETLGFDAHTRADEASLYRTTAFNDATNTRGFASVDLPPATALGPEQTLFQGPVGVLYAQPFSDVAWVAQRFEASVDGYLSGVDVALKTPLGINQETSVQWAVYPHSGASDAPDTAAAALASGVVAITVIDGGLSDATFSPPSARPALSGGVSYWLLLRQAPADASSVSVYYNDVGSAAAGSFKTRSPGGAWTALDVDGIVFQMCAAVRMAQAYHRIEAPGMYSLVGERYVTLRCPEIEDKSYRNAPSNHELGLGKIRLGVVGFSQNRLDYNKVALRELFPIGKLPHITLRFEAGNGKLYDFKGVNHTLVLVLHYYHGMQQAAVADEALASSILNPNYRLNFMDYQRTQEEQEEESDDQSIHFNEDDELAQWRLRQLRNTPEQRRLQDLEIIAGFNLDDE